MQHFAWATSKPRAVVCREGVCKKSTLCMLVKMLKIMDGPLQTCNLLVTYKQTFNAVATLNSCRQNEA